MSELVVLYFGCWSKDYLGHFLYDSDGNRLDESLVDMPWSILGGEVDAVLPPFNKHQHYANLQPQFSAALHRRLDSNGDEWTAIAFWDRTADNRYGSNSAFFVQRCLSFEDIVAVAQEHFPDIFKRFGRNRLRLESIAY